MKLLVVQMKKVDCRHIQRLSNAGERRFTAAPRYRHFLLRPGLARSKSTEFDATCIAPLCSVSVLQSVCFFSRSENFQTAILFNDPLDLQKAVFSQGMAFV